MFLHESDFDGDGNHERQFSSSKSKQDVNYSCGTCGYALNLSSSNRNTKCISAKYGKSMKRGIISFFSIDESRFTQVEEFHCVPYFISKHSWGLFRHRTKLLCRKCGNYVGTAYDDKTSPISPGSEDSSFHNVFSGQKKYNVKIRALRPSDESGVPLFM